MPPVDKYNFTKKQNLQKLYPAETNLILSLAMTSIFVVHIYACSNTIYWQLLYLCCVINVVLGFYFSFVFVLPNYVFYILFHLLRGTEGGFMHRHGNVKVGCCFFFFNCFFFVCTVTTHCFRASDSLLNLCCVIVPVFFSLSFFFLKIILFCCGVSQVLVPQRCL